MDNIGHNNPPSPVQYATELFETEVAPWLAKNPVIETENDARIAKRIIDKAKAALEAIEDERDSKVRPLNETVKTTNAFYKSVHNTDNSRPGTLDKILFTLMGRLGAYMAAEEEKRIAEAARLRKELEAAEAAARAAEAAEAEAKENASFGEVGVDVAAATIAADKAFAGFEQASRFADRAMKDTSVRVGGGFGKTATLRTKETLHVRDALKAFKALVKAGISLDEAILTGAREYRRRSGDLPAGVEATTERVL